MGIIVLVVIGGIGLLIFIIYATVKTKSTAIGKYEPYRMWIGQTVRLNKETYLFKEKIRMGDNRQYPYTLLDSLHPQWQYVRDQEAIGDVTEIMTFPEGTPLKLERAIQYTNGVSGFSDPTIFGTITYQGKEYKAGYQWGNKNMSRSYDRKEDCWQFHEAPWQDQADTTFYALPTANFW